MQHQFKPGDLALITGSVSPGSPNIGRSVELDQIVQADQEITRPDGSSTTVRLPYGITSAWVVVADGLSVRRVESQSWVECGYSIQIAEHLMPLRDDHAPQSEKQKELTHGQA